MIDVNAVTTLLEKWLKHIFRLWTGFEVPTAFALSRCKLCSRHWAIKATWEQSCVARPFIYVRWMYYSAQVYEFHGNRCITKKQKNFIPSREIWPGKNIFHWKLIYYMNHIKHWYTCEFWLWVSWSIDTQLWLCWLHGLEWTVFLELQRLSTLSADPIII